MFGFVGSSKLKTKKFLKFFHQPKVLILPDKMEKKETKEVNNFNLLTKELNESLTNIGIMSPTEIQQLTIPKILKRKNVLIAAQTGFLFYFDNFKKELEKLCLMFFHF
jgi:superfamily II DNA/RNA helicase